MALNETLYAGYGAMASPMMLEALTARTPYVVGMVAMKDVELCIQGMQQIPDEVVDTAPLRRSPRQMIRAAWDDEAFESYVIRQKAGTYVSAMLYRLSDYETELLADWELNDFGWHQRMDVTIVRPWGNRLVAKTDGIGPNQAVQRVVPGIVYTPYLRSPAEMHRRATQARTDYLRRAGFRHDS